MPKWKIDINEYCSRDTFTYAVFLWKDKKHPFDTGAGWQQLASFKTLQEAEDFYMKVKDLPIYL